MLHKIAFAHAFAVASAVVQLVMIAETFLFAPFGQEGTVILEVVVRNFIVALVSGWITGYLIALVYNKFAK